MAITEEVRVWVDSETTGLNIDKCDLIEVEFLLTDKFADHVFDSFRRVIKPDDEEWHSWAEPFAIDLHNNNDLFKEVNEIGVSLEQAEQEFLDWLDRHSLKPKLYSMYGANVANFDRQWLKAYMPKLEDWFHYRNVDVSTLRNRAKDFYPKVIRTMPKVETNHRTYNCLPGALAQFRHLRDNFLYIEEVDDGLD